MARHNLSDPAVQTLRDQLADLVLQEGSVSAAQRILTSVLDEDRSEGWIHANRLHTLLSDDISKSINTETIDTLQLALARLKEQAPDTASRPTSPKGGRNWRRLPVSSERADRTSESRERILKHWDATARASLDLRETGIIGLSEELQMPVAVIRRVLETAKRLEMSEPTPPLPASSIHPEPDWSFQDTATERTLTALRRGPDAKVGLILPTGAGKTRVAMRILLHALTESPREDSVVVWITHRTRLAQQARRELQRAITEGTPGLPPNAGQLLAQRVEILMISELSDALATFGDRIALVVVDEAHHAAAPSYQPIFEYKPLRGLFLTATPNRTDELPIGIDEIAYSITYRDLFERGVIIEPTIDELTIEGSDWTDPENLRDLADYVLQRAEDEFVKTLVVASRITHVEAMYDALVEELLERQEHVLTTDDVFFVYAEKNSSKVSTEDLLDEFSAAPRGVLISTSQLLGEGFDDRTINAVVVTYPTTSMIQLMQAAGRALRSDPGKHAAFIVQIRESDLAYHYEQRWLYQDISDLLHPQLMDIDYGSMEDLERRLTELLELYNASPEARAAAIAALADVSDGDEFSLLLNGLPYDGSPELFATDATWRCVPVTPPRRPRFISVFNDFSARETDVVQPMDFLRNYLQPDPTLGSEWRLLIDMLNSMAYAHKEIVGTPYVGASSRNYTPNKGTSWLTYVTFRYRPLVPASLEDFLADALNRDAIIREFVPTPSSWFSAAKVELPLGGTWAFLLVDEQDTWLSTNRDLLITSLTEAPAEDGFIELARWRTALTHSPIPLMLVERFETFVADASLAKSYLALRPTAPSDATANSGVSAGPPAPIGPGVQLGSEATHNDGGVRE